MTEDSSHESKHTGRLEKIAVFGALANIASWIYLGVEYGYFGAEPVAFYAATVVGLPLLAAGGALTFVGIYIMLVIQWRGLDPDAA